MATQNPDKPARSVAAVTKTPGSDREIFDKHGASQFLGFSSRTMDTWIQKKRIPYIKLPGGSIRFRRSQLIAFLKKYDRVDLDVTTIDTDQLVANAFDRAGYRSLEDTKILAICSEIIIETYQEELRRLDELAIKRGWLLKKNRL